MFLLCLKLSCRQPRSAKNRQSVTEVSTRSLPLSQHNLLVEKGKAMLSLASLSQKEHLF